MNAIKKLFSERVVCPQSEADKLRKIPQRRVSACEILSFLTVPFLLIMAGAMPSAALFVLPVVLCMLYLLYRRFGVYFPASCLAGYGVLSLVFNYDILTVIYLCGSIAAFVGLVLSVQLDRYLVCVSVAAIAAIVGALSGAGIVRLAENKPIANIAHDYVICEMEDPVIGYLSRDYYDGTDAPPGQTKLNPNDEGYALAAAESLGEWAADEFGLYIWYYCIHFGAVFGVAGFAAAHIINRRTACCYDIVDGCESVQVYKRLNMSARALGGARVQSVPLADMSMPRAYLWTCVLPAFVTGVVLEFIGGYEALSATVMHMFVTLPSAFCCFTLFAFFASLFKGKARVAANIVLFVSGVAALIFPIVLFVMSLIGISDCILNLRFWTRFIAED